MLVSRTPGHPAPGLIVSSAQLLLGRSAYSSSGVGSAAPRTVLFIRRYAALLVGADARVQSLSGALLAMVAVTNPPLLIFFAGCARVFFLGFLFLAGRKCPPIAYFGE